MSLLADPAPPLWAIAAPCANPKDVKRENWLCLLWAAHAVRSGKELTPGALFDAVHAAARARNTEAFALLPEFLDEN